MANNNQGNLYSGSGDPNFKVTAPGGSTYVDVDTGGVWTRASSSIPGSTEWELKDAGGGGQQGDTKVGNTIFVDIVNGNDSTGTPGTTKAFQSLLAAKNAAVSGDLIFVWPGTYTVTDSILKNGVNWFFNDGTLVLRYPVPGETSAVGILDDKGAGITCSVSGRGRFVAQFGSAAANSPGTLKVSNANSNISVQGRTIYAIGGESLPASAIHQAAGELRAVFDRIGNEGVTYPGMPSTGSMWGAWWTGGTGVIHALSSGGFLWDVGSGVASGGGDWYVSIDEIGYSLPRSAMNRRGSIIVDETGVDATAALWVVAKVIWGDNQDYYSVHCAGANKLYISSQKIYSYIKTEASAGLVYITTDKMDRLNGVGGGQAPLTLSGGETWINVDHLNDASSQSGPNVSVSSGTHNVSITSFTGKANSSGISISGGTLRLRNSRIDTSLRAATSPISKSGGTLILDDVTLLANSSADSISADSAQDVVCYLAQANKAASGNITFKAGTAANNRWLVSSDVV